jgi:hypothetical protein
MSQQFHYSNEPTTLGAAMAMALALKCDVICTPLDKDVLFYTRDVYFIQSGHHEFLEHVKWVTGLREDKFIGDDILGYICVSEPPRVWAKSILYRYNVKALTEANVRSIEQRNRDCKARTDNVGESWV